MFTALKPPQDALEHDVEPVSLGQDRVGDAAYDGCIGLRVDALAPHHLAHVRVEPLDQRVARCRRRTGMRCHGDPSLPRRNPADSDRKPSLGGQGRGSEQSVDQLMRR